MGDTEDVNRKKTVFVTVGTTCFDALVRAMDTREVKDGLLKRGYTHLIIQMGRGSYTPTKSEGEDGSLAVDFFTFSSSIADHLRSASLVISHAGSGSIFETLRLGKPLIVVVNEDLMDNHQRLGSINEKKSGLAADGNFLVKKFPPGDCVGLYFINRPEWLIMDHTCSAYSFISVPLYDTLGPDAVQYVVNHAALQAIFCSHNTEQLGGIDEYLPSLPSASGVKLISYLELISQGVVLTHKPNFKFCWFLSFTCHIFLWHTSVNRQTKLVSVYCGIAIGFYQGDKMKLMDDAASLRPTIFCSVPRLYNQIYAGIANAVTVPGMLRDRLFRAAYNSKKQAIISGWNPSPMWDRLVFNKIKDKLGGRVRLMASGASPLSPDVMDVTTKKGCFGCHVIEGYGMTETSSVISIMDEGDTLSGHVGSPNPACEIKLVDVPEMNYNSEDQPHPRGEICVRGPIVFQGYYRDEVQTREVLDDDGWLRTGDIGLWLPGGRLKIVDRENKIFKLAQGEYIAPEKIENVYAKCKFVSQCLIYGDSLNSSLVAVVVVDPNVMKDWASSEDIKDAVEHQSPLDKESKKRRQKEKKNKSQPQKGYGGDEDERGAGAPPSTPGSTGKRGFRQYESLAQLLNDPRVRAAVLTEVDNVGREAQSLISNLVLMTLPLRGFGFAKAVTLVLEPFSLENYLLTPTFKANPRYLSAVLWISPPMLTTMTYMTKSYIYRVNVTIPEWGQIGYMAPEYAMDGSLSEKADVFSYGVLVLEITWLLYQGGRELDLVDPSLTEFNENEAMCIGLGLLCCQQSVLDRPAMNSVHLMLSSDSFPFARMPRPGEPRMQGLGGRWTTTSTTAFSNSNATSSPNNVTRVSTGGSSVAGVCVRK
ncbi:Long chain acyl-CoA synthetase 6, peroxisomal [Morella rubra]|uniref:Long chain acyl-CoA synthetase 6, peroxisomal n=1 Tax=Morella rubra TaxID=262757 RepID=A0A6A1UUL3_9ROSI|nr:Long chain acyl-CoA synthetase 6, peroxisomal [Morella rubra]